MANEKVSQMVSLTAAEVVGNDLFMIIDSSARESKKISITDVITYFEATGSFGAHAILADTASYIRGVNVDGSVVSASYSQTSTSASHANNADSATTASFALNGGSGGSSGTTLHTGSTYPITSSAAVSSSYAVISAFALSAQNLQYTGAANGTASFALSSSNAIQSVSSSFSSTSVNSSLAQSASFLIGNFNPVQAWACVTWSVGKSFPQLYKTFNISSVTFLNTFFYGGDSAFFQTATTWSQFGITFDTPLSNNNYVLMGDGYRPYNNPERVGVLLHPIFGMQNTSSFTMSVATMGVGGDWYITVSGSYPNDNRGFITFQILGSNT